LDRHISLLVKRSSLYPPPIVTFDGFRVQLGLALPKRISLQEKMAYDGIELMAAPVFRDGREGIFPGGGCIS
jgi:hypothetical protein